MINSNAGKNSLILGTLLLAVAVMAGAFGAHGLENRLEQRFIETYQTGVTYHFYHAFGLMLLGFFEKTSQQSFKMPKIFFLLGIVLFSSNCYFYALTQVRTFALIVPIGGVCYILGWLSFAWVIKSMNKPSS